MSEKIIDLFPKIETEVELRSAIPMAILERLGGGETGEDLFINLLVGLSVFAPEPAEFDRNAFSAIVAVDSNTNKPLSSDVTEEMIRVALEMGLMTVVEGRTDRYTSSTTLSPFVERIFED